MWTRYVLLVKKIIRNYENREQELKNTIKLSQSKINELNDNLKLSIKNIEMRDNTISKYEDIIQWMKH